MKLSTVVLDCPDPDRLAAFYQAVTGWKETYRDDDTVQLGDGSGVQLGFQRVADQRPPSWPGADKQVHLDFTVSDLGAAAETVLALGATRPDFQPGDDQWLVLADPAGHLFCLVPE